MTKHVTINLRPANENSRSYGILMESETEHDFTGRGIHNRHHRHVLQVWENRPSRARDADPAIVVDPHGDPTTERYSFLWSPQANVISLHTVGTPDPVGVALALGDVVIPQIYGYRLGTFQIHARSHHNPHLMEVDTAASNSRQHFIETGDYMTPAEVAQWASL